MPASQRSARALFLRFTLVASRTWSGEKKGKHSMSLSCPWSLGCPPLQQRPALPVGLPVLHLVQTGRTHAMKHLLMWRWGGWHTRAKPHHGRTGVVGVVWQHPARFSCTLSRPCPGKAGDRVLVLSPEAAAHLWHQEPAVSQQLCPEAALELLVQLGKQFAACFSMSPSQAELGRTPASASCGLWLAAMPKGKAHAARSKCSWSETSLCAYGKGDLQKEDLHSLQSLVQDEPWYVYLFSYTHTQSHTYMHAYKYTHCVCIMHMHTDAHTETLNEKHKKQV